MSEFVCRVSYIVTIILCGGCLRRCRCQGSVAAGLRLRFWLKPNEIRPNRQRAAALPQRTLALERGVQCCCSHSEELPMSNPRISGVAIPFCNISGP